MKHIMAKLTKTVLFSALLFSVALINFESLAKKNDDPFLKKSFNLGSGELFVSTSGGSIRVEGSSTNKVEVEMYVKSNKHSDSKMREILEEDYEISIEKSGSRVEPGRLLQ